MHPYITSFQILEDYKLHVVFNDTTEGIVDIASYVWGEAFSELKKPEYFRKVKLNKELGALEWPNGVDIASESLYQKCKTKASCPH